MAGSSLKRQSRTPIWSLLELGLLGCTLEAVYLFGLVLPYNLFRGLEQPAEDLGKLSGATGESALAYVGCITALILVSWRAYGVARRVPVRWALPVVLSFAAVFTLTLLWMYPIDALDIFDYAMHGRILSVLGGNPYLNFPIQYPDDPFLPSVGWKQYPSVYGPLWIDLSAVIVRAFADNLVAVLLSLKTVASLAMLACTWLAHEIVRIWEPDVPGRAAGAALLVGWNPLILVMVASGHNDVVMLALLLTGIWLAARGYRGWGICVGGLSTLIKLATAPALPALGIGQLAEVRRGARAGWVVLVGVIGAVAISVALYAPLWPGLDRFGPLLRQDLVTASPLGTLRDLMTPTLGSEAATSLVVRLGQGLLVVITLFAAWRARQGQRAATKAAHDALFWTAYLALAWWQPWYAVWVACLGAIDDRRWVATLSWIVSFSALIELFNRFYLTQHWIPFDAVSNDLRTLALIYAAPIVFATLAPLVSGPALSMGTTGWGYAPRAAEVPVGEGPS